MTISRIYVNEFPPLVSLSQFNTRLISFDMYTVDILLFHNQTVRMTGLLFFIGVRRTLDCFAFSMAVSMLVGGNPDEPA